ncbi:MULTISPECIES: nitroreductase [unclassified Roseitalea]|uniref:nitroreductase family protein n=1 Tax=unclassified Roseitalea TaxID=2639107 RepID=UPI00273E4A6F|nr:MULTISPECIES: nitroreductase [unclassified Roseitalea]
MSAETARTADETVLAFLERRRSVPLTQITGPGPTEAELRRLLGIAARAPDHGRLEPWRFIVYRPEAGRAIGERLAALAERRNGPMREDERERERNRLARAPVAVGVVSTAAEHDRIPQWEQFLSAGAVAMNLVTAATAQGLAANWVTGWFCDDAQGRAIIGLAPHERMAAIVHIGHCNAVIPDRPRPDVDALITQAKAPAGEPAA